MFHGSYAPGGRYTLDQAKLSQQSGFSGIVRICGTLRGWLSREAPAPRRASRKALKIANGKHS